MTLTDLIGKAVRGTALGLALYVSGCTPAVPDDRDGCNDDYDCREPRVCVQGYCEGSEGESEGESEDLCAIRETGPCEDFSGVYEVLNFEKTNCYDSRPADERYIGLVTDSDCYTRAAFVCVNSCDNGIYGPLDSLNCGLTQGNFARISESGSGYIFCRDGNARILIRDDIGIICEMELDRYSDDTPNFSRCD